MASKLGFLILGPSSLQLTPSILTANATMFVYKADKTMEKNVPCNGKRNQ